MQKVGNATVYPTSRREIWISITILISFNTENFVFRRLVSDMLLLMPFTHSIKSPMTGVSNSKNNFYDDVLWSRRTITTQIRAEVLRETMTADKAPTTVSKVNDLISHNCLRQ